MSFVGAGAWLEEQVRDRAMSVRVFVVSSSQADIDAYFPMARAIRLSHEVYSKHDPSFWAVAAHELGHAIFHARRALLDGILLAARIASGSFAAIGSFLIFANVLYGLPQIDTLAFALVTASAYLYALVLVDEAVASVIASRILARDGRVGRRALLFACIRLLAAFATYVAGLAGQVLLVLERGFVIGKIEQHRHFVAGAPLGGGALLVAGLLSASLLALSARAIVVSLRRTTATTAKEVGQQQLRAALEQLARGLTALPLLWLVWDQPFGVVFAVACVLGLLASRLVVGVAAGLATLLVRVVVAIPVLLVLLPLTWGAIWIFARWWRFPSSAHPWRPPAEPGPPSADIKRGEALMEEMRVEVHNAQGWLWRAPAAAFAACHVAFVVTLWVELLGH